MPSRFWPARSILLTADPAQWSPYQDAVHGSDVIQLVFVYHCAPLVDVYNIDRADDVELSTVAFPNFGIERSSSSSSGSCGNRALFRVCDIVTRDIEVYNGNMAKSFPESGDRLN